jgi:hypothetical protein
MSTNSNRPFPADLLPALAEASLDLIHYGTLENTFEQFDLERVQSGRSRSEAEGDIARRLETDRPRVLKAVELAREAASYTESFDAGVRSLLQQSPLQDGTADRFAELLDRERGGYAAAALELVDRSTDTLGRDNDRASTDPPPVSGGSVSGCDLIALGAMLGGATCVVGCGPCCGVGVGGALLYVAAC